MIDLERATTIDLDGAYNLSKLRKELQRKKVTVVLARVNEHNLELLRKAGSVDEFPTNSLYSTVRRLLP